jgi:hypothetical protein
MDSWIRTSIHPRRGKEEEEEEEEEEEGRKRSVHANFKRKSQKAAAELASEYSLKRAGFRAARDELRAFRGNAAPILPVICRLQKLAIDDALFAACVVEHRCGHEIARAIAWQPGCTTRNALCLFKQTSISCCMRLSWACPGASEWLLSMARKWRVDNLVSFPHRQGWIV